MTVTPTYPSPLDDAALAATWEAAWSGLGLPAPAGLQARLMTAWSEPHRRYHDQRHLRECLALWQRWHQHALRAGELALALWFHDAVYDPRASGNELGSATWATRSLVGAGADSETAQRVHDLVMATQHDATADLVANPDARLMLDIDLSILGSPAERFERYDRAVRQEYAWVPGWRYRQAREAVLQGFLERPRLYHSAPAHELLEAQARVNLRAALSRLAE
ncbi:MAG: N-methyl-D-aspartate receptor NMDAR2C subunit [Zoogloea sp.]|nr:N-methyl-D-aspartate receptor NMDAR2C subunit [Zoogloea sp.]